MTGPARLRGLRLHGFKSFAERTLVEFGPGVSAVVGPNGSGKSNLADALRWALGEQGRSLRIRRSEDVIWAGSERRAAQGMADVTLLLDNGDALLPVEYAEVELGRRLYRSGENEYLLNRQRVRLRDLVDLLDAAHLADNAFLFIGQGMVDQALALRPEERRPLFEEVAGVRRHERRRRRAEEQLAESESNLARVEDILAELRPQARRLALQAEQQATRASAGDDLAAAILGATHARWHGAAARVAEAGEARARAHAAADAATASLAVAEATASAIAGELTARGEQSRERQAAHDAARSTLESARLREARLASELEAIGRDRDRLTLERDAAAADAVSQRRNLARPLPERDLEAEAALGEAERALAEALAELGTLRAASEADAAQRAAIQRAAAARAAEAETARRRLAEAQRRAAEEAGRATEADRRRGELETVVTEARAALETARAGESAARDAREAADAMLHAAEAEQQIAAEDAVAVGARLAAVRARHEALAAGVREDETRGIARAARRRGGRRVDDELAVEPRFGRAVERALGELVRGYVVAREDVAALAAERGQLVVADAVAPSAAPAPIGGRAASTIVDRATELGGGPLAAAIRRDPVGAASTLLGAAVWLPDLATALTIQPALPRGWLAVTLDGQAVLTRATVSLGSDEGLIERRAEVARLATELAELEREAAVREETRRAGARAVESAREAVAAALVAERERRAATAAAEDALRVAERGLETAIREAEWHAAQARRLSEELERARAGAAASETPTGGSDDGQGRDPDRRAALAAWEARAAELRARRDRLAAGVAAVDAERRAAEQARARAEAAAGFSAARAAEAERSLAELTARERVVHEELTATRAEVGSAARAEAEARAALERLRVEDAAARDRLAEAEAAVHAAREALRAADERLRAADVADLEARLGLESLREAALVELAGLGDVALRHLHAVAGGDPSGEAGAFDSPERDAEPPPASDAADRDGARRADADATPDVDPARLDRALVRAAAVWTTEPAATEAPSPAVLARLRRRYHELGSGNPFAADEYAALRTRLESLESQAGDLRGAIVRTRQLIADLDRMIAAQFESTFRALESAFDARFRQLFGGGFARLSLTEPGDLGATGVEIVARPPGKKAQALAMLSGGERALTAVALLFAMLEVRPVPFCVLDEVDAALDEANIGRFTDALRALADRIQFIVITHNRGTIESADALYGVTVGDDSVSRVISLRLEEARAIAERRGATLVSAAS